MEKQYDLITAKHYAAYRPPLHKIIIEKCINRDNQFQQGLDIGCGTGQSAIALADYCSKVIGIEPSRDMLKMSIIHPKIEYKEYDKKKLAFPDSTFDVVTFAGSLFYAKSQELLDEVVRVCQDFSTIILYDFNVSFEDIYSRLNILHQIENTNYDYKVDFSGLENNELDKLTSFEEIISLKITSSNLAHLILSMKRAYKVIVKKYNVTDPFTLLVEKLETMTDRNLHELKAKIYYTNYRYLRNQTIMIKSKQRQN
jgi:ubiquinone/menaquinone biosynthesis C-methylase UbiE